ncbi:radical SAM family heme chaperone HemW [Alloacidobacterium dinghuense]|uniref:Heme chaperone HemW n=1 Tax=Alloacidobacterium dinghuense TaxID=2763107 RepID=A0A7G8BP50_9BACT|nr:radical SAM family heme chaperone HemW [Alloacidobacterium dinghuense]QNI34320.1 radical SAM family heme chaperone HemW [Alloacidobacterium dinghuense]
MDSLGIYISVPFCRSKCTYCNFASGVFPSSYMARYVDRVCEDLRAAVRRFSGLPRVADSVYLGGGTPSLLPPDLLKTLFGAIREHFLVKGDAEITIECAPGQLAEDSLDAMVDCGVNRISFGVQSFVDQEAKATGRLHTRAIALEDIDRVYRAGVERVNADLIAGLPHQTAASWTESLDVLMDSGVDHASIYMLEVDDESRLGREVLGGGARYFAAAIPSDDAIADMYTEAVDVLAKRGLAQYEISNFARMGAASVHNLKYWRRLPYLGLGLDAHSMLRTENGTAIRFATTDDLQSYLSSPGWEDARSLTRLEELEEAWFLGLRLNEGVDLQQMETEFDRELVEPYKPLIEDLSSDGLLTPGARQIALSLRGRMLSNEVFARFLDVIDIGEPASV